MASFNFGKDSNDLDLSVGGDQGITPKQPAVKPAAPENEAQRAAQRPARPTANRTANLLQGQQPQPPRAPQRPTPQQPPRRQQPAAPAAPITRAPAAPVVNTQEQTFPASQIPAAELAHQLEDVIEQAPVYEQPAPTHAPEPAAPPIYLQPAAPEPQQAAPTYAPQQPAYEQPYAPAPQPARPPVSSYADPEEDSWQQGGARRRTNEEPAFMSRQSRGGNNYDEDDEPRQETKVVAKQEPEKMNPLMAFLAPFLGKGSNQNGNGKAASKKGGAARKRGAKQPTNDFAGGRQRVLIIRIAAFTIGGIVLLSGARALLFPYQGPSRAAVEQVAQEAVGYTGFPDATGQGAALAFTTLLLNYSETGDAASIRQQQLLRYTTSDIFDDIGITYNREGLADNAVLQPQTIVQGPYLVAQKNLDKTHALITTTAQVNTGQWLTVSIPMLYTASSGSVTVYGSPTFMPNVTASKVPLTEFTPNWGNDSDADNAFRQDLINYLTAWAKDSDQSLINRYLTNDASATAKQGLNGAVVFASLSDGPNIEAIDPQTGGDPNSRRAQFTVVWENPQNHLTYSQTYRAKLKFQQQRWFIQDITNISLVKGQ